MQLYPSQSNLRFPSYNEVRPCGVSNKISPRLNPNISGMAHPIEAVDAALERPKIQVYNELSAAAVAQRQPKLRALRAARTILVTCHPVLFSIEACRSVFLPVPSPAP